ncbi:hypothetical protein Tco_0820843 [Tanacetum coccineum]|uniref:Uncharacterized protein n=1 Tax=Tanacetum coccineum TaxID=301880 RepID=A0ABQ5ACA1_9ASTR
MTFEVATLRVVVHAGDKTSGDARSWYMINGDVKSWSLGRYDVDCNVDSGCVFGSYAVALHEALRRLVELDSKLLLSLRFMIILPKDGLAYSRPYSYLMDYFVTPPNSGMQRNGNNGVLRESSESDSEREGSEDEGPDFEEEGEEAVPEGQQQQHSS